MLDHIFLTVGDIDKSIVFNGNVLPIHGITNRHDYDGRQGPAGHPELKGLGAHGRMFFWLRVGRAAPGAAHVGFVADSEALVVSAYDAAGPAGAVEIHPPGPQLHCDPRYHAAKVANPDGYSLDFVLRSWRHGR